ncbi:glycosyltransferase [Candidatus Uhrbacteria bacterium]|nr:glycosyltransferase [Candidatus Uhrbacteria bacterium]
MSKPAISVIIPVFNHADALRACLRSLEKQTIQDFEIIIVDDGSDTPVMNAAVRFEKNKGAPSARNAGFAQSKGEYVIFLDADAVLRPDALEKLKTALDKHPEADFAYSSFKFGFKTFSSFPFDRELLRRSNYIHTSALIRRETFPGFDESLKKFQDWDLFLTMVEAGKRGIFVYEVLFSLKTKGTMSQWLPSLTHFVPWPLFGWMPKSVAKYQTAEKIIREKHRLPAASPVLTPKVWLGLVILLELMSVPAAFYPTLNSIFAVLVGVFVLLVSFVSPVGGFSFLVLELLIGSKGRLLVFGPDAANDGGIALRIILFAAFFAGWIGSLIREKRFPKIRSWIKGREAWIAFAVVLVAAFIQGLLRESSFLVADANAWVFLFILIPALDLAQTKGGELWSWLGRVARIGIGWISLKTLALFYFFSHDFGAWLEPVYLWVRKTGVGEVTLITKAASGYRIFIQSQIYPTLASIGLMSGAAQRSGTLISPDALKALAVLLAVVVVSFSRSFWIGVVAGCFLIALDVLRRKTWMVIPRFALSGAGALLIAFVIFSFPLPASHGNFINLFLGRADAGESAAQSRWELLPVLNQKIMESPLIGHGFGATGTYQSKDPRIVAKTGGSYTTYAFEWGWHDFVLKFGLIGTLIYLWLLLSILKRLGSTNRPWQVAVVVLAVVHVFTPYLNHPLGLLVLVLTEVRIISTPKT